MTPPASRCFFLRWLQLDDHVTAVAGEVCLRDVRRASPPERDLDAVVVPADDDVVEVVRERAAVRVGRHLDDPVGEGFELRSPPCVRGFVPMVN